MVELSILRSAACHANGGARSFPNTCDAAIQRDYGYRAPTLAYEKLFYFQASQSSQQPPEFSAGWIVPEQATCCNPVFIAHSTLAAIWLLQKTLPADTLPEHAWLALANAAVVLSTGVDSAPPSAQVIPSAVSSDGDSEPVVPRKRPAPLSFPSTPASSPKRTRDSPDHALFLSGSRVSSPKQGPGSPQGRITKVSNNNRRAEQQRAKKRAAAVEKRRHSIGLLEPPESAEPAEKIAYNSISRADEQHIAWITKQPVDKDIDFFTESKTPYKTAYAMLTKARAVGNKKALLSTATFLQSWRSQGSPVPLRTTTPDHTASSQIALRDARPDECDGFFQRAWGLSSRCQDRVVTVIIEYRWAMALLGHAYEKKMDQIRQTDQDSSGHSSCRRGGRGTVRGEAVDALMRLVDLDPSIDDRTKFRKRLARATRWFTAAKTLGWGSLCLMPTDGVSNTWVEKEIHSKAWEIWLELVKRIKPEVYSTSLAFDRYVGQEGIYGGPIQGKDILLIDGPSVVREIEELPDSTDEEDSDGDVEGTAPSRTPKPRSQRQHTLLRWFQPQKT
jgi:hypothetical protein